MNEHEIVLEAVREAGALLRAEAERKGGPRGQGTKAPVDEEIEALLIARLSAAFPDDAIIAEETGGRPGRSGRAFVVDPHDGTQDFLQGRRETSVSVAQVEGGVFLQAAVFAPCATDLTGDSGIMVSWTQGEGIRVDGSLIEPAACPGVLTRQSVALISANVRASSFALNEGFLAPASVLRCASVATRFALVAAGRADAALTVNNPLADWDFAGGQALLKAVGGDVVGPGGAPVRWEGVRSSPQWLQGYFAARSVGLAADVAARYGSLTGVTRSG